MKDNALMVHGGAPTSVMNASLYGAVVEMKKHNNIEHFYAAVRGTGGILREDFIDLFSVSEDKLKLLPYSPASAIGTSRDQISAEQYNQIAEVIKKWNIRFVFFNGGNGSMDTCGRVYAACKSIGVEVFVVGIPKTIDNDLCITDHAPGYGSAARYIAESVHEISADVKALPIHVSIVESMGRNVGWIAAASALARLSGDDIGPDLIYLPERAFDEEAFLGRISNLLTKKSGIVVVVSEGIKKADGTPIVQPIMTIGRAVYYGDVGTHLANLIIKKLGYKARSEKPGLCGRASIELQSDVDRQEAIDVGQEAVRSALKYENGIMIGMRRLEENYQTEMIHIPIQQVMMNEKRLPDEFINADGTYVTQKFISWCQPLLGKQLNEFVSLI